MINEGGQTIVVLELGVVDCVVEEIESDFLSCLHKPVDSLLHVVEVVVLVVLCEFGLGYSYGEENGQTAEEHYGDEFSNWGDRCEDGLFSLFPSSLLHFILFCLFVDGIEVVAS